MHLIWQITYFTKNQIEKEKKNNNENKVFLERKCSLKKIQIIIIIRLKYVLGNSLYFSGLPGGVATLSNVANGSSIIPLYMAD